MRTIRLFVLVQLEPLQQRHSKELRELQVHNKVQAVGSSSLRLVGRDAWQRNPCALEGSKDQLVHNKELEFDHSKVLELELDHSKVLQVLGLGHSKVQVLVHSKVRVLHSKVQAHNKDLGNSSSSYNSQKFLHRQYWPSTTC